MGGGSFRSAETQASYASYTKSVASATRVDQVFTKRRLSELLNPKNVMLRESCDGEDNPNSRPIIIGLDVTGSMGMVAKHIAQEGLGEVMNAIFDRQPVKDPHLMFMGIGDAAFDDAPLQVSQFEADFRIVEQLSNLYVEGCGGNNQTESYDLPWYFAGTRTQIDSLDKRGEKGYLFTMGDELPPEVLRARDLQRILGDGEQHDVPSVDSLKLAEEKYHVFHLIIEEGGYARRYLDDVVNGWQQMLHHRALRVNDYRNVSQIIISAIEVSEGGDPEQVANSWKDANVQRSVRHALGI